MSASRRHFLRSFAATGAGLVGARAALGRQEHQHPMPPAPPAKKPQVAQEIPASFSGPREIAQPMLTPDLPSLPWKIESGVKVFHLIAEPVERRIVPFKTMNVWGFNGTCPGRAIQANQGERVRIHFENRLPESTSIHWHGLEVPLAMDGVPYISQPPVPPGGTFTYEFTLHQEGTFFYHTHGAMQEMMGLIGMFIIHPAKNHSPRVDHDFGIILQGWSILPSNSVPNSAAMEFNWLTFNGVSSPSTTPIVVPLGSRVRIRIVNLGMDHHPIHLHGHQFVVTGTEGGRAPESTWYPGNTVLVGVAQARDIEFDAQYPGEWMLHCHLPHHMMNAMTDLLQDRAITTTPTNDLQALSQMQTLADRTGFAHVHHAPIAKDAEMVAGFPQDAFMEMGMDELVARPETRGLPPNWSAGMMGMMTMVRVLPPEKYEEIVALRRSAGGPQ